MQILLVDLNPGKILPVFLNSPDFELSRATGIQAATMRLAARPAIDLVLLDLDDEQNPDKRMSMFDSLVANIDKLPIIVISECSDFKGGIQFLKNGAQDYISRTSAKTDLCERMRFAIERKKFDLSVRSDVDKSRLMLEKLVQERTLKLTQSNEELRQFAKIASHDLQEPLRCVEGFVDLLREKTADKMEPVCLEYMDFIVDGAQRMRHLISSVLRHSQIKNDEDGTNYDTNSNQVLQEVIANLGDLIEDSRTTFETTRLPCVSVEHSQLSQLFQNLISNSIKYRRRDAPHIRISAERSADMWLFSFHDNGIGIDAAYAGKIFDMFSRLHAKTKYPGSGIGLAICKRIVTSNGGSIWVESKPDHGSIFLFTLPAAGQTRRNSMKSPMDILLVEDTLSDVRLTEEALQRSNLNYELKIVGDGVEATEYLFKLKELTRKLPDIILLDLNMPRKNGHEVLNEIKNDIILRQIPVILLTVSESEDDVQEALKQRMNYYMAKPVNSERLSTLIRAIHDLQTKPVDEGTQYTSSETHMRLVLAGNPHTSMVALRKLAADPNVKVRSRVAENPGIAPALIEKLSLDPSVEVRLSLCENPSTPRLVLEALASDSSEEVRLGLASNPHLPEDILNELSNDDNVFVSSAARNSLAAQGV